MNVENIGFVSTRFAGIDGVSLEASKWAEVFEQRGHRCFWFAGKLDRNPEKSSLKYQILEIVVTSFLNKGKSKFRGFALFVFIIYVISMN